MNLKVNGKSYQLSDSPDRSLLYVLREELDLTGTKYSCGIGECGCCEVHVDGVVTRSCITMLSEVEGAEVKTIEGLAQGNGTLHPVQQAFIDEQTVQCGWCMSGQIMRAVAFLGQNPDPTEEEIVEEMNNNYCRCGTYGRIKRAISRAATQMAAERKNE